MVIPTAEVNLVKPWTAGHNSRCEVCDLGGEILLCDYCNVVYHLHCLKPPRAEIPSVSAAHVRCFVRCGRSPDNRSCVVCGLAGQVGVSRVHAHVPGCARLASQAAEGA